jgi:hypothetical protein
MATCVAASLGLRDGRFDAEQQRVPELARFIEAHEPRLIAFNEYVNEDHSQVSVVQIHLGGFTRARAPGSVLCWRRWAPGDLAVGAWCARRFSG